MDNALDLPEGSVRDGEFVAKHIEPREENKTLPEEAIQPNGVDLSIGDIYSLSGSAYISNEEYEKPDRAELDISNGTYLIEPDTAYVAVYGEIISIPKNHIGLVFPRSRLMRCGLHVETAVWDSGYTGIGEGQLAVNQEAELESDLRIAQIIFVRTEELEETYDGSHQEEKL